MKIFSKVLLVCIMLMAGVLYAEVPDEVTYTGRLREFGNAITGFRNFKFDIYPCESGGVALWSSGSVNIEVSTGVFCYKLKPKLDLCKKDLWIETVIGGRIMSPREKITSQVYALHAGTAEDMLKSAGQKINFTIGNTNYLTISETEGTTSGRIQINSGSLYFPDGSSMNSANTVSMVPQGAIIMWSGAIDKIPPGWALCDGQWYNPDDLSTGQVGHVNPDPNYRVQTPNLKGRFVVGYNYDDGDYNSIGKTGGEKAHTLAIGEMPAHLHSVDTRHTHTAGCSESGEHQHGIKTSGREGVQDAGVVFSGFATNTGNWTNPAGGHTHNISISQAGDVVNTAVSGSSQPHENRPNYYTIAYIIKL